MKATLNNVQHLRGIAALLVVVSHLLLIPARHGADGQAVPFLLSGEFGVDIFFVISGFIMYWTAGDAFGTPGAAATFLTRRIIRIVPIYWIMTAVETAMGVASKMGQHDALGAYPQHVVESLLFIPYVNEAGKLKPMLGVGWSLNYEMMFYLIFALALKLPKRPGIAVLLLAFAALILLGAAPVTGALLFWTRPIILQFLIGMGLAMALRRWPGLRGRIHVSPLPAIAGVIAVQSVLFNVGMLDPGADWRPLAWSLAVAIVALALLCRDSANATAASRVLGAIGDSSYSLYIVHSFIAINAFFVLKKLHVFKTMPVAAFVVAGALLCTGACWLFYRYIERPIGDAIRGRMQRDRRHGIALA